LYKSWESTVNKLLVVVLMALLAGSASAAEYRVNFTAGSFVDLAGTAPPPLTSVSGYFQWSAADATAPIEQLTGTSLSIGGHAFALDELGFENGGATTSSIGGNAGGGANFITAGTDDFVLTFDRTGQFYNFIFTVPGAATSWISQGAGSVLISAVPEPSTSLLALLGVGVFAARKLVAGSSKRMSNAEGLAREA
jgi:hypothetical protein